MRSRFVLYGLLVGCAALATMIYRHLFADEPIRFDDLRRLIVLIPLGALLLWFRTNWLRQVRHDSQRNKGEQ